MKVKIKDLTEEQINKLCPIYHLPCPDNCPFKLDKRGFLLLSCKLTNPKYKNEIIEVED